MKIIVDIPEEVYKASQLINVKYEDVIQIPLECIANGTPINSSTDCVSRESVSDLVDELARAISDERNGLPLRGRDAGRIMCDIWDLPSVTPERPRGKWIEISSDQLKEFGIFYPRGFRCSQCNRLHPHKSDYCEHCGSYNADMMEVPDGNNRDD